MSTPYRESSAIVLKLGDPAKRFSGFFARLGSLVSLFVLELIVISMWLDTSALEGRGGLAGSVGDFGPHILQSLLVFVTVLLGFGYSKARNRLALISEQLVDVPLGWSFLAAHCAAMGALVFLSSRLFAATPFSETHLIAGTPLVLAWLTAGLWGIAAGVFFFIPPKTLRELLKSVDSAWIYAVAAAVIAPVLVVASKRLWKPTTALTFELVRLLLSPLVSGVVAVPATGTLGTQRFAVEIAPACSGLEGVGLMLIFSVLWLWCFRNDYRFPRALLLIPIGIVAIFILNSVRIAALILIGDAGATTVALGGFHSQAGWIAFNGVALGLASLAHRVPYLSSGPKPAVTEGAHIHPDAYLAPFMGILAATMISRASSGSFEWMYPLRFVAATAILLLFRRKYRTIDWRFGWAAPVAGGAVFVLWIGLDRITGNHAESAMPTALAVSPAIARVTWLVFRTLAAVITVPIAEELAFRGFLLRRLISPDFESVSLKRWTLLAVFGSSLAFGILHGDRWIAGTVAGMLYAAAQRWRGRIGDAVVAHGVTNALISISVLWGSHWSLW